MNINERLDALHRDLGWKRLNPTWAKGEILLGLSAASSGHLYGVWTVFHFDDNSWPGVVASIVLQVLGLYLAMAGHRSHIYQSQNKLTAYLAMLITREKN